jgi:ElaB/YqjD/DUF883 family membrane-anchored ribosome-binding protein
MATGRPGEFGSDDKDQRKTTSAGPSRATPAEGSSSDIAALRDQVQRLANQFGEYVSSTGSSAVDRAKEGFASAASSVGAKSQDAAAGVREVGDNLAHAIDQSLERRPYATLAVALGMGFIFAKLVR